MPRSGHGSELTATSRVVGRCSRDVQVDRGLAGLQRSRRSRSLRPYLDNDQIGMLPPPPDEDPNC